MNMLKKAHWFGSEMLLTLSGKKSFFSSKRIERMIVFTAMLSVTLCFVWHSRNKMTATDLMIIVAGWMVYGGFNTVQIKKDIKENEQ